MASVQKVFCFMFALMVVEYCSGETQHYCPHQESITEYTKVEDELIKESGIFLGVVKKTVVIPNSGVYSQPIQCIFVTDLTDDQSSGKVEIIEGGVQYYNAIIELTSQFGKGMNYRVQVYTSANSKSTTRHH